MFSYWGAFFVFYRNGAEFLWAVMRVQAFKTLKSALTRRRSNSSWLGIVSSILILMPAVLVLEPPWHRSMVKVFFTGYLRFLSSPWRYEPLLRNRNRRTSHRLGWLYFKSYIMGMHFVMNTNNSNLWASEPKKSWLVGYRSLPRNSLHLIITINISGEMKT